MSIIDERGRLFGRLNLVDAAVGALLLALMPAAYGAYLLFKEPVPKLMLSNALRAGLHGLVNALSREVAADQVTVNALMPGYTLTERLSELKLDEAALAAQIPAGRIGGAEDFGSVAAFLASERAGYITGQAIACDGGVLHAI